MIKLAKKIEELETGEIVTITTEDGKKYTGEMCETQGRVGRELRKLVKSNPQTVITIEYEDSEYPENIKLEFESDPSKEVSSVTV